MYVDISKNPMIQMSEKPITKPNHKEIDTRVHIHVTKPNYKYSKPFLSNVMGHEVPISHGYKCNNGHVYSIK